MINGSARLYVIGSSSHGLTQETCTPDCRISPENRGESELVVQITMSAPSIAAVALSASIKLAETLLDHSSIKRRRESGVGLKTFTCFRSRTIDIVTKWALACQPAPNKAMILASLRAR